MTRFICEGLKYVKRHFNPDTKFVLELIKEYLPYVIEPGSLDSILVEMIYHYFEQLEVTSVAIKKYEKFGFKFV